MPRTDSQMRLNYLGVPLDRAFDDLLKHARAELEQLLDYAVERTPPGYFVRALLENDLIAALDTSAFRTMILRDLALYVRKNMPAMSHGSREAVAAWLAHANSAEPRAAMNSQTQVTLFPTGASPMAMGR